MLLNITRSCITLNCAFKALTSINTLYENKVEITKELTGYVNSMHLFSEFYDGA